MVLHGDGIMLIFSRTETQMFQRLWRHSSAIMFLASRVRFCRPDGTQASNGTAPSSLVAFGSANVTALRRSGLQGAICWGWDYPIDGMTR